MWKLWVQHWNLRSVAKYPYEFQLLTTHYKVILNAGPVNTHWIHFFFSRLALCLPTFFDGNGWFLLPQTKKDEEKDQRDEDLKRQHPLVTKRDERTGLTDCGGTGADTSWTDSVCTVGSFHRVTCLGTRDERSAFLPRTVSTPQAGTFSNKRPTYNDHI